MKKILLATSILAGSAGVASADVSFSGNAYMGISNENAVVNFGLDTSDFEFIARARLKVTMTGETDGGVSFGASFEMHNAGGAGSSGPAAPPAPPFNGDSTQGSAKVWIEGEFGKITMGDIGTAPDTLIGNVDGVGLAIDPSLNELGYGLGGIYQKTGVNYSRTFGDFTLVVGASQTEAVWGFAVYSIAAKYSFGDYAVYAGYESLQVGGGSAGQTTVGADATFGNFTVKVRATDGDYQSNTYAISGTGTFDAISVTAFYADYDGQAAYGLGGAYDLGGGAKFKVGAVGLDGQSENIIDMGLSFDF